MLEKDIDKMFAQLKADIRKWCNNPILGSLLTLYEQDGDMWIMARKEDTSMDLKARRDMNAYLIKASRHRKKDFLAKLYVSELPERSIEILHFSSKKNEGWEFRIPDDPAGSRIDKNKKYILDEEMFTQLFCDWIAAYFSLKSVYYYA